VVHFEIYADDAERAIKFYGDLFGWKIEGWGGPEEYWLITTGDDGEPGINGAIMKRPDPAAAGIHYVDVPSVDEFVRKAVAGGGSLSMPKVAVTGIGYAAVCRDSEGNAFGLFQNDPAAG
jgi:predicted enzyme related to lactoylglutathione lyase